MVFPKKKWSSPKFGIYFLNLIIVAALKFVILPHLFFYHCPKNFSLAQIFPCHFSKNYNFFLILETLGKIAPMPLSRYGFSLLHISKSFYFDFNSRLLRSQALFWQVAQRSIASFSLNP